MISLALHMGLRRSEIFRLMVDDGHFYNAGVLVRHKSGDLDLARVVPWTSRAHFAVERWIKCRTFLGAEHNRLWLNLHAGPTANLPLTVHTFNRVLVTYLGPEWSFARLRVTSAVLWTRCGLPLERPAGASVDDLVLAMRVDKKARAGTVRFSLPRAIGVMHGDAKGGWTVAAPEEVVRETLAVTN